MSIVMVAEYTGNDFIGTSHKIKVCLEMIHKASKSATLGRMRWNRATSKLPPAVFSFVTVVALNTTNILIFSTHEEHGLIKIIHVIISLVAIWKSTTNVSAFPIPNSVLVLSAIDTRNSVHSAASIATSRQMSIVSVLILKPS